MVENSLTITLVVFLLLMFIGLGAAVVFNFEIGQFIAATVTGAKTLYNQQAGLVTPTPVPEVATQEEGSVLGVDTQLLVDTVSYPVLRLSPHPRSVFDPIGQTEDSGNTVDLPR